MDLRQRLENCDPNSATSLTEIYGEILEFPELEFNLARLCADPAIETQASWLIKRRIERGYRPNTEFSHQLLHVFPSLSGWLAKLHVLQVFQNLSIPPEQRRSVRNLVLELAGDPNKFIRAWSYSALHYIALAYPEFKPETSILLQRAAENEAPSVKARLRNLSSLQLLPAPDEEA